MRYGNGSAARRAVLSPSATARGPLPAIVWLALVAATLAGACGGGARPTPSPIASAPTAGRTPDPAPSPPPGPSASPVATPAWVCLGGPCPSNVEPGSPAPAGTATPSAGLTTVNAEGYRAITLPGTGVHSVPLVSHFGGFHRFDSEGPLVVLDETGACSFTHADGTISAESSLACRSIVLVDLVAGTFTTLQQAPFGWRAWLPVISADRVAWIEYHSEGREDTGPLDWRILLTDLASGATRTVASGVHRQLPAGGSGSASWPALDLDGDRLAYATEDPARPASGWKIVVLSLSTGTVEREIAAGLNVYDVAIDGGDVAWTEGKIDPHVGFTYATRLMVSTAARPAPRKIADHAYEVAFDAGRLAWGQDSPVTITGAAQHTRIWTATSPDFKPKPASPVPQRGLERYQAWPKTGGGFVTWESYRFSETDQSLLADKFCLWNPADGHAYEVNPTRGANLTSSTGGWFVWIDWRQDPPTVSGIPIAEIGLP